MKKIVSLAIILATLLCALMLCSCGNSDEILVNTNAFFAPFEYYDGTEIVGVDVDIMALVGEKLGKKIKFFNTDFGAIIDNVKEGKICDCGAAGLTITEERSALVDFSIPYYTSVQYVICSATSDLGKSLSGDKTYFVWEDIAGMAIGVQGDTTGWIYVDGEINGQESDPDYGYDGVLYGTGSTLKIFDSAQLAADGIGSMVDVVVVDELPAEYIVSKNSGFVCAPLYYAGETKADDAPVEEQYAICVTKGNDELLGAINEVLTDLLKKGDDGLSQVEKMVMEHMGF
ncbi:MAG: transporter substrate-binding domain-containing protein [Clostridiales bacterium]|nr:transporter substrate-binding domain-containing protein [Clostridiales bacterium]